MWVKFYFSFSPYFFFNLTHKVLLEATELELLNLNMTQESQKRWDHQKILQNRLHLLTIAHEFFFCKIKKHTVKIYQSTNENQR